MTYLEFEKAFKPYPVFSIKDIIKRFPGFDNRRLVEWQKKGYLIKVKRGYYCFGERKIGEHFLYFTANKIYSPSYISMESALAFYNLIPEGVFTITSVTTNNTAGYDTSIGTFEYKHLKPLLFFGYKLLRESEFTIKIAEPEKVILDYFYLNPLNSLAEIEEMRFNEILVKELISLGKLWQYLRVYNSKILDKRIQMFLKVTHA
jgi:predicted transcriptional regulator of viral defense system